MKKLILFLLVLTSLSACQNQDIEFPDFKYSAVYFAYQTPVRTITLGEDFVNTDLDNQHKCKIFATIGGVYNTKKDVTIDFVVADTICTGYSFDKVTPSRPILPMPHDYYTLASNQIVIKKGEISGGVEVQLTDKFFQDPLAIANNYVIPLKMTHVTNADSILCGKVLIAGTQPRILNKKGWDVVGKDYVLYALKYINTWHGTYLRRGTDNITGAVNATIIRHPKDITVFDYYTDNAADSKYRCDLSTISLNDINFPVTLKDATGASFVCKLVLSYNTTTGKFSVSSSSPSTFTATGTGEFVKKGEKNSFGNQDRDVFYLDYTINHTGKNMVVATKDTLLLRNRGVVMETFTVK